MPLNIVSNSEDITLLLVSPRKTGTHLFTKWLDQRYQSRGQIKIGSSKPGYYSCGETFHTSFNQFFKRLDVNDFTGGRLLPLTSCVGLTVCRHPADVFLSHLEYSFIGRNTAYATLKFGDLKDTLDFVMKLGNYEPFFESLFDYCSWSKLEHFVTVDFETIRNCFETNQAVQTHSVLQLADYLGLKFGKGIFGNSPTFNSGQIGRGIKYIEENCPEIFQHEYYLRICEFFGYSPTEAKGASKIDDLNDKTITVFDNRPVDEPQLVEADFLGYGIIYFNGKLYGLPDHGLPNGNDFFDYLNSDSFKAVGNSVDEVKALIGGLQAGS